MSDKPAVTAAAPIINPALPAQRISSVAAYRGFVMLLMIGEVFSFRHVFYDIKKRFAIFFLQVYAHFLV